MLVVSGLHECELEKVTPRLKLQYLKEYDKPYARLSSYVSKQWAWLQANVFKIGSLRRCGRKPLHSLGHAVR